jgi:RecB family exonuclease
MRERIILASKINGDELLRSLAANNVNCFNVRIMNATDLARYALMKSGVSVSSSFISRQEETALVSKAAKGSAYFSNPTYADIADLTNAIRMMRFFVDGDDEQKELEEVLQEGVFIEKNKALLDVYNNYLKILNGADSVGIIRKAISESLNIDADFEIIKELPLRPLELKLINKLSGGKFAEKNLAELYNSKEGGVRVASYKNCYGAMNEISDILTDIYSNKQLDKCVIATADPRTYSQLIFDLAVGKNIPVTFGCGVPITNSNPARLLNSYNRWMTTGLFSASALKSMLDSDAFDRKKFVGDVEGLENVKIRDVLDVLGQLRLTNDEKSNLVKVNDYIGTLSGDERNEQAEKKLKELAAELALPCEEFVLRYSRIRRGGEDYARMITNRIDECALSAIYNSLSVVRKAGIDQQAEDVISDILSAMICCQNSEPGKLHVTDISSAFSTIRHDIYVAGMTAANYPGTPRENYLLLDDDIRLFGKELEQYDSKGRVKAKRESLFTLARLAPALGCELHISFAGINAAELKKQNASSLLFDLYRAENGEKASIKDMESIITRVEYFDPGLDSSAGIGRAYNEGSEIIKDGGTSSSTLAKLSTDGKSYSPTALSTFVECRRKYMYKYILGLPEEDRDNPFEVMSASDQGIIVHALMEELADTTISKTDFMKLADDAFENHLKSHPVLISGSVAEAKAQFMDMMESAYDNDPRRKVVLKEEEIECTHEAGIVIKGFPDRVEQVGPDEYVVVDFKTGRNVKHIPDDIYSCLQVVIYSYLMEQKGYHIVGGEYRYLRLNQTITCGYDANMKLALKDVLADFMDAVKHNDYPCANADDKADPCKYCSYARLCGRVELEGED